MDIVCSTGPHNKSFTHFAGEKSLGDWVEVSRLTFSGSNILLF